MARLTLIQLFMILFTTKGLFACLWINGTSLDGEQVRIIGKNPALYLNQSLKSDLNEKFNYFKRKYFHQNQNNTIDIKVIGLIVNEQYDKAIQLLLAYEKKHPYIYSTAANLGTTYELTGNNTNALHWIKEGIKRNPDSHYRSEWLHQLILEYKILCEHDKNHIIQNRIIPLPEKFDITTKIKLLGKEYTLGSIREAIEVQLRERMLIIKPQNPVVADLLYTLAEIESQVSVLENSIKLLDLAIQYGFLNTELITNKRKEYNRIIFISNAKKYTLYGGIIIIFTAFLYYLYKKKIFLIHKTKSN